MTDTINKETDAPTNMKVTMSVTASSNPTPNELKRTVKIQELPNVMNHVTPAGISRERSFVRAPNPQNHQNVNKRRSLGFQHHQQQLRMKPALEIYRPPSKGIFGA